jgi:hypothetical protein
LFSPGTYAAERSILARQCRPERVERALQRVANKVLHCFLPPTCHARSAPPRDQYFLCRIGKIIGVLFLAAHVAELRASGCAMQGHDPYRFAAGLFGVASINPLRRRPPDRHTGSQRCTQSLGQRFPPDISSILHCSNRTSADRAPVWAVWAAGA